MPRINRRYGNTAYDNNAVPAGRKAGTEIRQNCSRKFSRVGLWYLPGRNLLCEPVNYYIVNTA